MAFSKFGIALGAALISLPMAAAQADPNTPISSSGEDFSAVEVSGGGWKSRSYSGTTESLELGVVEDALSSVAGGELSADNLAWLATLKPMTAPTGTESIIGADQRKQIGNTKKYPYRAVVLITFNTPGGGARCTGWMISKDTVATAGHCVYDPGVGFYSTGSYLIRPGFTGASAPFGQCNARTLHTVTGWANGGDDQYDYGAIKLDCNVGSKVGWFGYFWTKKDKKLKRKVKIAGYPGDKPLTQWYSKGKVKVVQKRRVFYKNDTTGGMSGSPVYTKMKGCNPCSMAVHAYGTYGSPPFSTYNHGTRITKKVFKNFKKWKK